MRLYSRTGATTLDDPEFGHFEADGQGGFDLPEELAERIRSFHVGGKPLWETDIEQQNRLIAEELERRKDPASLYEAVQQLVQAAKATSSTPIPDAPPPAAKTTRARKTAAKAPAGD